MSDAWLILLPILAGLIWAAEWMVDDAVFRLDGKTLLGLVMLVGMVVLGIVVVVSLRDAPSPF